MTNILEIPRYARVSIRLDQFLEAEKIANQDGKYKDPDDVVEKLLDEALKKHNKRRKK
jgi:hypothetical protein